MAPAKIFESSACKFSFCFLYLGLDYEMKRKGKPKTETIQIRGGRLGPLPPCKLPIKPFTVLIGPQGTGKSLLAQLLYLFRALPDLVAVTDSSLRKRKEDPSVEALIRRLMDGLRSSERAFAVFAHPSVTVRWTEVQRETPTLGVGIYSTNRRTRPDSKLEKYVLHLRRQHYLENRAVFIPTERLFYSQVRSKIASDLLSLPLTYDWFSSWMERAADMFESWPENQPDTPQGRWIHNHARNALRGEAFRRGGNWKWRFDGPKGTSGTLDLEMSSSGQRATWPIVLLAETLFSMRKRNKLASDFTLYVEEPEIHLHPAAQRGVIEILAYLVNNGFRVVMTTHSLTALYSLNNLIMASGLPGKPSKKETLPPEVCWLKRDKVCAYALGGPEPIDLVDSKTGFISEAELGRVSQELGRVMNRITFLRDDL